MDRSNLRSLAENATPFESCSSRDLAAFIAAASPPVVLSLLDRIEELEGVLEAARQFIAKCALDERNMVALSVFNRIDAALASTSGTGEAG